MHQRTGKIARLPEHIRNQVNQFLDDGLEYQRIIDWLANNGHPGFTANNLSRWKDGGYQDWCRHFDRLDELECKLKWAAQIVGNTDKAQLHQGALALASLQLFEMLNRFDPAALNRIVEAHPEKYPTLVNSLAKFTREVIALEKFKAEQQQQARRDEEQKRTDKGGLTPEGRRRVREQLRLPSAGGNDPVCASIPTDNQPV